MNFTKYLHKYYGPIFEEDEVDYILKALKFCVKEKIPIYVIGNGGSAYSGNHFVQDLVKACGADAVSLAENIGIILAISNDISFDDIFEYQLKKKVLVIRKTSSKLLNTLTVFLCQ
jgi:phosphoheptose isomerase